MPTILVADDNSNIQKMVTNALKEKGIEVIGVANGDAAIKKLEILNPDMVLADVFMPVKDGYELCEWIKNNQRLTAVPVFLLVGAFDPLDEHRVQSVKADGVLKKPFVPPDNLIGAVMAMLERSAKSRAAAEMQSTHTEFASSVPDVEETQKLTDSEVAEMTGQPAPPPEPEPEMDMYATRPARLEFGDSDQPLGLDDAMGGATAAEVESESEEPAFRASSVEEVGEHGITEEARQPSPDLPPIKVDFGEGGDAPELVTSDSHEGYASISSGLDSSQLPELVGSGEDVAPAAAAPPPPPPPPTAMEMSIPEVRVPETEPEPEPEPEPAPSPMGMSSAELPGLSWSEPAAAAPAPEPPPPPPAPSYTPPPPVAPPAPVGTPELVPRMMPLSQAQQDALVDEIVDRVVSQIQPTVIHRVTTEISKGLEMLQPQLLERITKEVIRPIAEDMIKKKTDE